MPVFKIKEYKDSKIGIWRLTEDVDELYALIFDSLSIEEKQQYGKYKSKQRKCEWLATRILLQKMQQASFYSVIKYSRSCKPYLETQKIGISHSRDFVAVILSDTKNVSIDVEKISSRAKKIAQKFLSFEEQNDFDINDNTVITLLWSVKETVYKYYGQKELAFINEIKICSVDFSRHLVKVILKHRTKIEVNFEDLEDNILTFIL